MGGRVFMVNGVPLASRIPNDIIWELAEDVVLKFQNFFAKSKIGVNDDYPKEDHGDLDIIVVPKNETSRNELREACKEWGYLTVHNGNFEHVLYPFRGKEHQIDFIFANTDEYSIFRYFYASPTTRNAIVGHFARSLGYKFSTKGMLLHITDKRGQNYYYTLTTDLELALSLLQLEKKTDKEIFASPEAFAEWIMASPRFDTERFESVTNKQSHRDARTDSFCNRAYEIIHNSNKKSSIPSSRIDFKAEEFDLANSLKLEESILGDNIVEKIKSYCKEKSRIVEPIISGDLLIEMGYKSGPLFRTIIQRVSEEFPEGADEEILKTYVKNNFPQ